MNIHHIGYAVKDLDAAARDFGLLGFEAITQPCVDEARHVRIQFVRNGDHVIELVSPQTDQSPIGSLLKKLGSTPYHLCYETADLPGRIESLKREGFVVIAEPLEAPAIEIRKVAFLFKDTLGVIELVEGDCSPAQGSTP